MTKSVDPDQTAPIGAVCSGSTLFASILNSSVMLGNYLQQTTSADDIFRCIIFLGALRDNAYIWKIICQGMQTNNPRSNSQSAQTFHVSSLWFGSSSVNPNSKHTQFPTQLSFYRRIGLFSKLVTFQRRPGRQQIQDYSEIYGFIIGLEASDWFALWQRTGQIYFNHMQSSPEFSLKFKITWPLKGHL